MQMDAYVCTFVHVHEFSRDRGRKEEQQESRISDLFLCSVFFGSVSLSLPSSLSETFLNADPLPVHTPNESCMPSYLYTDTHVFVYRGLASLGERRRKYFCSCCGSFFPSRQKRSSQGRPNRPQMHRADTTCGKRDAPACVVHL